MLKEQRQFRRALFFAALSLELVLLMIISRNGSIVAVLHLVVYPISLLLIIRPFDFFKESVEIRENHVVRLVRGKVIELMPINELVSQETHSILGFFPMLSLFTEKKRMDIPFMLRGTLELEKKLYGVVPFDDKSERFFAFEKLLLEQNRSLWRKMTVWFQWFYLFAIITPFLIWNFEDGPAVFWIVISLLYGSIVLLCTKFINRAICIITPKYRVLLLQFINSWGLYISFLFYLLLGLNIEIIYRIVTILIVYFFNLN